MNAVATQARSNSYDFYSGLLDLPDEILLMIVRQMAVVDAFRSLMDVAPRLRRLTFDPLHIRALDLTEAAIAQFLCKRTPSIDSQLLSTICHEVLPEIHHHVHHLTLDHCSVSDVLAAGSYPRLSSLTLRNCDVDLLHRSLTGKSKCRKRFSLHFTPF